MTQKTDAMLSKPEFFRIGETLKEETHLISELPDFGIFSISITNAARLISEDMWFSGEIDVKEPEDYDGSYGNPILLESLAGYISKMETQLLQAVDTKRLKAVIVRRDMEERIDPNKTFLRLNILDKWLVERGYESGDTVNEYWDNEAGIAISIAEQVTVTRYKPIASSADRENEYLEKQLELALAENIKLKKTSGVNCGKQDIDKPMSAKERRSLLRVIAALANMAKINVAQRGIASAIQTATETNGAPVTDDTIRKILKKIPDAL